MDLSMAVWYLTCFVMWVDEAEAGPIPMGIGKMERIHDDIGGEREK
jgi:hypothetical protein